MMAVFRVCKSFVVESGHMLSRHPERCRFPHGHTRKIEVVVCGEALDDNGMVVDFKALKLAIQGYIERFDHSMAVNSQDPLLRSLQEVYPAEALVVFEHAEPTTEAVAKDIFDFVAGVLLKGFEEGVYSIPAGVLKLERVRVWETPTSWAEYGV